MFDFQGLGLSAYVLCYGPLALVIFGFIGFAILTDGKARRTYLRRLDPRPEAERVDEGPIERSQPLEALTPSGASVRLLPTEQRAEPPPTTVETAETVTETEATADDLTLIEGIGPKISQVLTDAGVTTFHQLAQLSSEAVRKILDDAGMSAIHDPTTWPAQAALAAANEWEELALLQGDLRGGRRA